MTLILVWKEGNVVATIEEFNRHNVPTNLFNAHAATNFWDSTNFQEDTTIRNALSKNGTVHGVVKDERSYFTNLYPSQRQHWPSFR